MGGEPGGGGSMLVQAPQQPSERGPMGLVEGHEPVESRFTKPRLVLGHWAATPVGICKETKMKVRKRVDAMDVWLFRLLVQSLCADGCRVPASEYSVRRRWHRRV